MSLERNTIVTLDNDKKYFVASATELNAQKYCLLINETDYKDYKFCSEKNESGNIKLTVISNAEQQAILFNLFADDIKDSLGDSE